MRIYLIGCMPEGKNSDLEERIMKILLAAVNAKYIHSNLAVYSLKAYAEDPRWRSGRIYDQPAKGRYPDGHL